LGQFRAYEVRPGFRQFGRRFAVKDETAFCRVTKRRPCLICGKPDWCSYYVEFQAFFSQSFFHPLSTSESSVENDDRRSSPTFSATALTTQTSL